jgi:ATP-dependent DNA helicase RecQ
MQQPSEILAHYFGYEAFREPQQAVIESVLEGKDTLALLPTGGGKSICFQVPALMLEGVCIVVTPLIALMKDQVAQLKKRNIKAAAIFSGLSYHELDIILDNCVYGYYRFLYVSPERLQSELFIERFKQMKLSLIAVDEAHCISQWGYDFRPSYLTIAAIRKYHTGVPVIALTASATLKVQEDIVEKLEFKQHRIFKKSFVRDNLSFVVRREEAKYPKLLEIISKLKGSGIIYVRNRNKTKDVADYLLQHKIDAGFYHAGLKPAERNNKQDKWIKSNSSVIVCTNAFGMGIDKPNVRYVIHLDIPESLEAYYQEAGRAGRDGKLSYAVLLFNQSDIDKLKEKAVQKFPPVEEVKKIYNAICNYAGISVESGKMKTFDFDLFQFCHAFKLQASLVFNCLKMLEQENYLQLNEGMLMPPRAIFRVDKLELYRFEVSHSAIAPLVKAMLRTYGGIIDHYTKISEAQLAKLLKISEAEVVNQLNFLHKNKILTYIPANDKPAITLLTERMHESNLYFNINYINQRKEAAQTQLDAMLNYTEQYVLCRQVVICSYFDEEDVIPCGKCDCCLENKKKLEQHAAFNAAKQDILEKAKTNWVKTEDVLPKNAHYAEKLYKDTIRFLLDERLLLINDKNELKRV